MQNQINPAKMGEENSREIWRLLGESTEDGGNFSGPIWDMSVDMETSILNQYEEDFSDVFQPQENTVERFGDVLFNLVNNDDQPIDIIDFILHDDKQQDTQVLHELEDNAANRQQPIDSPQHAHIINDNDKGTTESSPNLSNRECLSTTPPVEHLLQAHYAETFYQTLVDIIPVIGSPAEEQSTVNAKKENPSTIVNNTDTYKTENKEEIETEISNSITTSIEICKSTSRTRKRTANIKKTNKITKKRRIDATLTKTKREEQEECVDIETISDEVPVLEAGDVTSLLEQFEATENMMLPVTSRVRKNLKTRAKLSGRPRGRPPKYPKSQDAHKRTTLRCNNVRVIDKDLQPRVVIERLKIVTPIQDHKTVTVAIPDIPKRQHPENSSCNINQIQDDKSTLSSNNSLKVINSTMTNLKNSSNNATQSKMNKSFFSIYHDHDYCSNNNSITNNISTKRLIKRKSKIQRTTDKDFIKTNDTIKYNRDSNLKKNTDLVSTIVNDMFNIPSTSTVLSERTNSLLRNNQNNGCAKEAPLRQIQANNLPITINVPKVPNKSTNIHPVHEMKINSALAKSILKSRQDLKLKKMQIPVYSTQQMVSILKNPPNKLQPPTTSNLKESIVTTTDSTNEIIQNIVIQNTEDIQPQEQVKQPIRKRLKLEEYRNRKQKHNGGNVMATSKRYVELVPIYNVFTSTEPFTDNFGKQTLYQQELILDAKYKQDTEEGNKSKPTTRDVETQTYRENCESSNSLVSNENKYILKMNNKSRSRSKSRSRKTKSRSTSRTERNEKDRNIVEKSTESRNIEISLTNEPRDKSRERTKSRESRSKTRSVSRSRSIARSRESIRDSSKRRSRSSNDSKTRNESSSKNRSSSKRRERSRSRSRCRSRSRKHSPSRQRKRRRSSSSSSNSSYSSRSKHRRSRSKSRSYQSRSRSSSRHYINHLRLSSHSNSERNRWSNRYNGHERSYERYKSQNPYHHPDRDWKRSPLHYYHRHDSGYYDEKQKQVNERRVIYVGGLDKNMTKTDLYNRFGNFGPIVDVSIHPRNNNDNYGFITFLHRKDAYKALEHGNDNLDLPRYDLSFGGRRAFCQVKYEDLDGMANDSSLDRRLSPTNEEGVFDYLLREAKKRLD